MNTTALHPSETLAGAADVSVAIPTYNRPDLLDQAIESILSQTLRPRSK